MRVKPSAPDRPPKAKKREVLHRSGLVTCWDLDVSVHAADGRLFQERGGGPRLSARGEFSEPVNGVTAFDLMLIGTDAKSLVNAECIGFLLRAKPALDGAVYLTSDELAALMPFAAQRCVMHCDLGFQKPRYGSGEILSLSFSTTGPTTADGAWSSSR